MRVPIAKKKQHQDGELMATKKGHERGSLVIKENLLCRSRRLLQQLRMQRSTPGTFSKTRNTTDSPWPVRTGTEMLGLIETLTPHATTRQLCMLAASQGTAEGRCARVPPSFRGVLRKGRIRVSLPLTVPVAHHINHHDANKEQHIVLPRRDLLRAAMGLRK
jgi:hypothetical protein